MLGGGTRGFYIKLLFRNLQKAIGGGGLEGFILSSYLETFTKAVGGGLEGFILSSYVETFRRAVGGGTRGFYIRLLLTRGFYIRFLFRNLGGDSMVWSKVPSPKNSHLSTSEVGQVERVRVWTKPSPPCLLSLYKHQMASYRVYMDPCYINSEGRGGEGLVQTLTLSTCSTSEIKR